MVASLNDPPDWEFLLELADRREQQPDPWERVHTAIENARQALDDTDHVESDLINFGINERRIVKNRKQRVDTLLAELDRLLETDDFDLKTVMQQIDVLLDLAMDDVQKAEINQRRAVASDRHRKLNGQNTYTKLRQAVDALLDEAKNARAQPNVSEQYIVSRYYLEAKNQVDDSVARFPGGSDLLQGLKREVDNLYEQARRQAEILTTALQLKEYEQLLDELYEIQRANPAAEVEQRDEQNRSQGRRPVGDVILYVQGLSFDYNLKKVRDEYVPRAREFLSAKHNPRAAFDQMQIARQMRLLNDEALALIDAVTRDEIDPELKKLLQAERLINEARNTPDAHAAMGTLNRAYETYQWVEEYSATREELLSRIEAQIKRLIRDAHDSIERGALEDARALLDSAGQLTGFGSFDQYNTDINTERAEAVQVENERAAMPALVGELRALLSNSRFEEVDQLLKDTESSYPGYLKRNAELRAINNRVEARLRIGALADHVHELLSSGNLVRMREVLDSSQTALDENKTEADRIGLSPLVARLEARYNRLKGEQAWDNLDANQAREFLTKVTNSTQAAEEDTQRAQTLLNVIRESAQRDTVIDGLLQRAESLNKRRTVSQNDLERVHQDLVQYRDTPTTHRIRFEQVFGALTERLEEQVIKRLDTVLAAKPINLELLEKQWHMLSDVLQSGQAPQYSRQITLLIARLRGDAAYTGQSWQEAITRYQTALSLDAGDKTLITRLEEARRSLARQIAAETLASRRPDYRLTLDKLRDFERDAPGDATFKRLRADVFVEWARNAVTPIEAATMLNDARLACEQAQGLAVSTTDAAQPTLEQQRVRIETQYSLVRKLDSLQTNRSLRAFKGSLETMDATITQLPEFIGIQSWWRTEQSRCLDELISAVQTRQARSYWDRFEFAAKVKVLSPDHELGQTAEDAPTFFEELRGRIEAAVRDTTGGEFTGDATDAQEGPTAIIQRQKKYIETLNSQLSVLEEAQQIGLIHVELAELAPYLALRSVISAKLQELAQAEMVSRSAYIAANAAKRSDSWVGFDAELQKLAMLGYINHQVYNALCHLQEAIRTRRTELFGQVANIDCAFRQDDYVQVIEGLNKLESTLDQQERLQYRILESMKVEDSFRPGVSFTGSARIKREAEERRTQINTLETWLGVALDRECIRANTAASAPVTLSLARDLYTEQPEVIVKEAAAYVRQSAFDQALAVYNAHLSAPGSPPATERPLRLPDAVAYLEHKTVSTADLKSVRSRKLSELGDQALTLLRQALRNLETERTAIYDKQNTFTQRLDSFDQALDALHSSRAGKNDQAVLRQRAHDDFAILRQIAPDYKGLMEAATNYAVLRG